MAAKPLLSTGYIRLIFFALTLMNMTSCGASFDHAMHCEKELACALTTIFSDADSDETDMFIQLCIESSEAMHFTLPSHTINAEIAAQQRCEHHTGCDYLDCL